MIDWGIRVYEFCFGRVLEVFVIVFFRVCVCWVIIRICWSFFFYSRDFLLLIDFFVIVWVFVVLRKLMVVFFGMFLNIFCLWNFFVKCVCGIYVFGKFCICFFLFFGWRFWVLIDLEWIVKWIWVRNRNNFWGRIFCFRV